MKITNRRGPAVDRHGAIPLYHQIFLQLRDEILSGVRAFGSPVATEHELSRSHGVSRITARRALDELAKRHFVTRKRRIGTSVAYRPPARPIAANIDQTIDSLLELGRLTRVEVVAFRRDPAAPSVAEALQLLPGSTVLHATRIRHLGREPLGYIVSFVPVEFAANITRASLRRTPILGLLRKAGHRFGKGTQTVAAVLADPILCAALDVEPRAALLRISRTVCNPSGRPIMVTWAHYRSDRYQMRLDLNI